MHLEETAEEATLKAQIKRYFQLGNQEKEIKKEKDPLNKDIKLYMSLNGLKEFLADSVKAMYREDERVSMNEAKLLEKLRNLGLVQAIKTVEYPDQTKIQDLMYQGVLTAADLEDCMEKTVVAVLTVKGIK